MQEKFKASTSRSEKGKEVMQEMESQSGTRKRKSNNDKQQKVEVNHQVDEEYFQNGRIYQEWDDLSWGYQPSNWQWDGDLVWGGETSNSGFNVNYNPESSNQYHLDDF